MEINIWTLFDWFDWFIGFLYKKYINICFQGYFFFIWMHDDWKNKNRIVQFRSIEHFKCIASFFLFAFYLFRFEIGLILFKRQNSWPYKIYVEKITFKLDADIAWFTRSMCAMDKSKNKPGRQEKDGAFYSRGGLKLELQSVRSRPIGHFSNSCCP